MMKPIEYLSLYLPYNLYLWNEVKQKAVMMNMGEGSSGNWVGIKAVSRYYERGNYVYKPILYPLSMLTEEIEHEGEKVHMMERIWNSTQGNITLEWIKQHHIQRVPYFVARELFKYHFDFFGLIDQGKAIDKTKL